MAGYNTTGANCCALLGNLLPASIGATDLDDLIEKVAVKIRGRLHRKGFPEDAAGQDAHQIVLLQMLNTLETGQRLLDMRGGAADIRLLNISRILANFIAKPMEYFSPVCVFDLSWLGADGLTLPLPIIRPSTRATAFTGSGGSTIETGGSYTGKVTALYTVTIEAGGTTFKWALDGVEQATGIAITGAFQTLANGLTIKLPTTGHIASDKWDITVTIHASVRGVNTLCNAWDASDANAVPSTTFAELIIDWALAMIYSISSALYGQPLANLTLDQARAYGEMANEWGAALVYIIKAANDNQGQLDEPAVNRINTATALIDNFRLGIEYQDTFLV